MILIYIKSRIAMIELSNLLMVQQFLDKFH